MIGASTGIGEALSKHLAALGARVIVSARDEGKINHLKNSTTGIIDAIPLDVSNAAQTKEVIDTVFLNHKTIDSIVFMAAIYDPSDISSLSIEDVKKTMDINFMGAYHVVHAIIPHYKKQNYGQIALCGSVAGYRGLPNGQPYSASKAALINFAESLWCEFKTTNIDVKLISPGFVRTPLTDKNKFPMPMMIEPEEAANHIAKGLLSSKFEIRFPFVFTSIMKIIALLPYGLYFKMFQKRD